MTLEITVLTEINIGKAPLSEELDEMIVANLLPHTISHNRRSCEQTFACCFVLYLIIRVKYSVQAKPYYICDAHHISPDFLDPTLCISTESAPSFCIGTCSFPFVSVK